MMSNLFSIFDPSTNLLFNLPLNWMSTLIGLMFIPYSFWLMPNRHYIMWVFILNKLHNEFKTLLNNKFNNSTFIFISMFSFVLFNNLLGLFPYIFTSTSHLTLSLTLSLPLWLSFMLYGWINNSQHMFSHLIPHGTPKMLMPFMVLIETISNMIRPGTLAVRLTANMIAGHLLMTLLSSTSLKLPYYLIFILILIQITLLILESAVAIIQSYVISILSTLYSSEVNH